MKMTAVPTTSQTVGPFFSIGLSRRCQAAEVPGNVARERVRISGRVLDGDGAGVPDAILEVWRPPDGVSKGAAPEFQRVASNERGEFELGVRKPTVVREVDGTVHAPHFVVLVFMRGLLRHLVTRIYFDSEIANTEDPVLKTVPAERRETLIAKANASQDTEFVWNIRLQGEAETVFFET
jgi:protocatechuate 3,4-dioxygenase alpha subunit